MTGIFLNFGAGPNQLPEPWLNLDPSHDIRKRLRFENDSVDAVLAEHVIEHVPFLQGLGFFREVLRVLEPGGTFRIAFPDVARFLRYDVDGCASFNRVAPVYAQGLAARPNASPALSSGSHAHKGQMPDKLEGEALTRQALWQMLTGWGHQMAWTGDSAAGALLVVGFRQVKMCEYGRGELAGIDGHHRDVGPELAQLESTILEAKK